MQILLNRSEQWLQNRVVSIQARYAQSKRPLFLLVLLIRVNGCGEQSSAVEGRYVYESFT